MGEILKIADAALVLGLHEQSVRSLTRRGVLPDRRDKNNERFFLLDELLELKRFERKSIKVGKRLMHLEKNKLS
ncbi:MAG: hypothetical protein JXQ25_06060 [Deltaproteobacteria bacterium]|nr:hypothetical protein [Deltaproteobacteria bacterium]